MNNFVLAIDGHKNSSVYYTDTDSLYIHAKYFDKLKELDYVGGALGQGKNDYGKSGILYADFIGPK